MLRCDIGGCEFRQSGGSFRIWWGIYLGFWMISIHLIFLFMGVICIVGSLIQESILRLKLIIFLIFFIYRWIQCHLSNISNVLFHLTSSELGQKMQVVEPPRISKIIATFRPLHNILITLELTWKLEFYTLNIISHKI